MNFIESVTSPPRPKCLPRTLIIHLTFLIQTLSYIHQNYPESSNSMVAPYTGVHAARSPAVLNNFLVLSLQGAGAKFMLCEIYLLLNNKAFLLFITCWSISEVERKSCILPVNCQVPLLAPLVVH